MKNIEIIALIQKLRRLQKANAPKSERLEVFNRIPQRFKIKICLGCGGDYADCDCPAGSAERLRKDSEIADLL